MHSQNFNRAHHYIHTVCCLVSHRHTCSSSPSSAKKKFVFIYWKDEKQMNFQYDFSEFFFSPRNARRAYICNWRWILKLTSENYENTFVLQSHLHDFVCKIENSIYLFNFLAILFGNCFRRLILAQRARSQFVQNKCVFALCFRSIFVLFFWTWFKWPSLMSINLLGS